MSSFRPMLGHLLVSVVFVDGPAGTSAAFSTDEKNDALREIFAATGVLRRLGETWGASRPIPVRHVCGFTVVNRTVALSRDPAPLAATPPEIFDVRDRVWLEDVLAAMGFPDGTFSERVQRLRQGLVTLTIQGLGVADAIPVFVTKYPCHHLAHCASHAVVVSWPGVVDMYPENIDGVFAHEVGHVFDAPDEYGHCTASEAAGFFDTPNANCTFLRACASRRGLMDLGAPPT